MFRKRTRHLPDLCNLVIFSLSYDNLENYLQFIFSEAILNSGGAPHLYKVRAREETQNKHIFDMT